MLFFIPVIAACVLSSCASVPSKYERPAQRKTIGRRPVGQQEAVRAQIVEYAASLLGRRDLERINGWFRNDCSGYVIGVFRTLGYRMRFSSNPSTRQISLLLHQVLSRGGYIYTSAVPNIADVVFFTGTVDPRVNKVSHVGIVSDVNRDGTIRILNYTSKGVTVLHMNLSEPGVYLDENGNIKNDFLRKRLSSSDDGKLLSGELFCCFGDLLAYCLL